MTENIPEWKYRVERLKLPCYLNSDGYDRNIRARKSGKISINTPL